MSGIPPAARTTVLCAVLSVLGSKIAVLIGMAAFVVAGTTCWPVPALGGPATGRICVPAGSVPVPIFVNGTILVGSALRVRFHSGPPTSISAPPWLTQVCKAINCLLLSVLVVKLSSTIKSKLFNTAAVVGMVLALSISTIIEPPWLGRAIL